MELTELCDKPERGIEKKIITFNGIATLEPGNEHLPPQNRLYKLNGHLMNAYQARRLRHDYARTICMELSLQEYCLKGLGEERYMKAAFPEKSR